MNSDWIAWAALIVAFVSAFFTALQWASAYRSAADAKRSADAAEKQVAEAEKARLIQAEGMKTQAEDTKRALDIARQSAEAAERLAEANEALALSGQRGWLIVESASVSDEHTSHPKVIVRTHFVFRNVGRTPIAKVSLGHCENVMANDPGDFVGIHFESHPTVAPNGNVSLFPLFECSPSVFSSIKSGEVKIYFYGNGSYEDIFGYSHNLYWRWAFDGHNLGACKEGNAFKAPYE